MSYTPVAGTIPYKVVEHLRKHGGWCPGAEVAAAIDVEAISPYMAAAIKSGLVASRPSARHARAHEYSIGDGKPLPRPADEEPEEPLARTPRARLATVPAGNSVFALAADQRGGKIVPVAEFRAGRFTDGTLVLELDGSKMTLTESMLGQLAALLREAEA